MVARHAFTFAVCVAAFPAIVHGASTVIRSEPLHLRSGEPKEWSSFPARSDGAAASLSFKSNANTGEVTLLLRQRDVKSSWTVTLNDSPLGILLEDERDMVRMLAVPS